jgi:hypothetical protein
MHVQFGKLLVAVGILTLCIGLLVWFFGDKFTWFGKLPGDLRFENERVKVYIPWVTMLVVSLVVSLLLRWFRNLF